MAGGVRVRSASRAPEGRGRVLPLRTARQAMSALLRLVVALLCLGASAVEARDLSGLYDRGVLDHWKPRYERSTTKILTDVILPALTEEERQRVGGFPRVDFP